MTPQERAALTHAWLWGTWPPRAPVRSWTVTYTWDGRVISNAGVRVEVVATDG